MSNPISEQDPAFTLTSSENESITTTDRTDHTQILLMHSDWKFIRNKLNKIKFNTFFCNPTEVLIGAMIPYIIQYLCSSSENRSAQEIIICIILIIVIEILKKVPLIKEKWNFKDNTENQIHVSDLKEKLSEIESQNTH